jgi:hypothetical protein
MACALPAGERVFEPFSHDHALYEAATRVAYRPPTGKEQIMKPLALSISIICLGACLAGCASSRGYETAFSEKQAIAGNSHTFQAARDPTFRAVTGTLVQKGFNIDHTDEAMGIIKATRNYEDPKDAETNYHITATAYVSASADGGTIVTLSASQQTVLYRHGHSWTLLPLLPIIPIPTGRKFETVTTGEGGITAGSFYTEFFAAVEHTLASTAPGPGSRVAAELPGPAATSGSAHATDK